MSGLGAQLREERERRQLTVAEVAATTHLKILIIDAMERNDYKRLIAPPYARGFYRLYCDFLNLDMEPFVMAYMRGSGYSDDKTDLIRDPKKKPGILSGFQKRIKDMQERKDMQRKAKEIAEEIGRAHV